MFLVLDTNIIVSALINPAGKPAQIFRRCLSGEFRLCADKRIFAEYETVLLRPKFKFDPKQISALLNILRLQCLIICAPTLDVSFTDLSDKKFYEVAKACNAVLVTGNIKHYPQDPIVKTVNDIV